MSRKPKQRRWCVQILELRSLYVNVEAASDADAALRVSELVEDDQISFAHCDREWWQVASTHEGEGGYPQPVEAANV